MTTTRPLEDLMAEQGLRLRQGLNEVLEGWDELGAEESDDDSNGGESEIRAVSRGVEEIDAILD